MAAEDIVAVADAAFVKLMARLGRDQDRDDDFIAPRRNYFREGFMAGVEYGIDCAQILVNKVFNEAK